MAIDIEKLMNSGYEYTLINQIQKAYDKGYDITDINRNIDINRLRNTINELAPSEELIKNASIFI